MPKRSRIAAKPGQRRPLQRARTAGDDRQLGRVTAAEEARAAELEAAILAEERAAEEARKVRERGRRIGAGSASAGVSYTSTPLSVRAAEEYAYVKRDMRRILVVGGFLLALLVVLQILVNGMGLFTL